MSAEPTQPRNPLLDAPTKKKKLSTGAIVGITASVIVHALAGLYLYKAKFEVQPFDYVDEAVDVELMDAPPPPPPPPPPPAKPEARQFVVYFDFDRSDLTAEARSVVTQAANYAKSGAPTRVLVVGHTDTSGNAAYNLGLSNRRARTVADALVAQGVNGGVISLDGKGETALAKPTADGVREPLNRRATIDINF